MVSSFCFIQFGSLFARHLETCSHISWCLRIKLHHAYKYDRRMVSWAHEMRRHADFSSILQFMCCFAHDLLENDTAGWNNRLSLILSCEDNVANLPFIVNHMVLSLKVLYVYHLLWPLHPCSFFLSSDLHCTVYLVTIYLSAKFVWTRKQEPYSLIIRKQLLWMLMLATIEER